MRRTPLLIAALVVVSCGSTQPDQPSGVPVQIEVEVEDGEVRAPDVVAVEQGQRVELGVRADVTDEIHVHGYDLFQEVRPGTRVLVTFVATISGIFEVELEQAGLLLLQLQVTPA